MSGIMIYETNLTRDKLDLSGAIRCTFGAYSVHTAHCTVTLIRWAPLGCFFQTSAKFYELRASPMGAHFMPAVRELPTCIFNMFTAALLLRWS